MGKNVINNMFIMSVCTCSFNVFYYISLLYNFCADELTMQLLESKFSCYIGMVFTGTVNSVDDLSVSFISSFATHVRYL